MLDPVGFWSYARQDDAHSDGQLSQLRAIVGKAIVEGRLSVEEGIAACAASA